MGETDSIWRSYAHVVIEGKTHPSVIPCHVIGIVTCKF